MKVILVPISLLFLFNSKLHAQVDLKQGDTIKVRKEHIQKEPMDTISNMLRIDDTVHKKQFADPQVIIMNKKKRKNIKSNRCGK